MRRHLCCLRKGHTSQNYGGDLRKQEEEIGKQRGVGGNERESPVKDVSGSRYCCGAVTGFTQSGLQGAFERVPPWIGQPECCSLCPLPVINSIPRVLTAWYCQLVLHTGTVFCLHQQGQEPLAGVYTI